MNLKLVLITLNLSYLLNSVFGYVVPVPPPTQHIEVISATAPSIKAFTDANYLMGSDRKTLYDVLYGSNTNTKSISSSLISYENDNDWEIEKPLDKASPFFAKFLQGWEAIAFATGVPVTYFMGQQFQKANDKMLEKEKSTQSLQASIATQKAEAERKARERENTRRELEAKIRAAKAEEERIRRNNAEAKKKREEKIRREQTRIKADTAKRPQQVARSGAGAGFGQALPPTPPPPNGGRKDDRDQRERESEMARKTRARQSTSMAKSTFSSPAPARTVTPVTASRAPASRSGLSRAQQERQEEQNRKMRTRQTVTQPVPRTFGQPVRAPSQSGSSRTKMTQGGVSRAQQERQAEQARKNQVKRPAASSSFGQPMKPPVATASASTFGEPIKTPSPVTPVRSPIARPGVSRAQQERQAEQARKNQVRRPSTPAASSSFGQPLKPAAAPSSFGQPMKPAVATASASTFGQPAARSAPRAPMRGTGVSRAQQERQAEQARKNQVRRPVAPAASSSFGQPMKPAAAPSSFGQPMKPAVATASASTFGQPAARSAPRAPMRGTGVSRAQQEKEVEKTRKMKVNEAATHSQNLNPSLTTFPFPPKINNSNSVGSNTMRGTPVSPPAPVSPSPISVSPSAPILRAPVPASPSAPAAPAMSNANTVKQAQQQPTKPAQVEAKKEESKKVEPGKVTTFPIPPKINSRSEEVRKVSTEARKAPASPSKLLEDALNTMTIRQLKSYIRINDKQKKLKETSVKKDYVNAALTIAQDKGVEASLDELQNKMKV